MAHHAPCLAEIKKLLDEIKCLKDKNQKLSEALESISKNTCCEPCQEAKLVALKALQGDE